MSYDTLVVAVNWYGPFNSLADASKEAKEAGATEALYLAISNRHKRVRAYVGISKDITTRITLQHPILGERFREGDDLWIGVIVSQGVAGRSPRGRPRRHPAALTITERTLAYFLQMSENTQLRKSIPTNAIILINRWFDAVKTGDDYNRKDQRGHFDWPDLIEHDPQHAQASLVWFGEKRVERLDQSQIEGLMVQ